MDDFINKLHLNRPILPLLFTRKTSYLASHTLLILLRLSPSVGMVWFELSNLELTKHQHIQEENKSQSINNEEDMVTHVGLYEA